MSYSINQSFLLCDAPNCNACTATLVTLGEVTSQTEPISAPTPRWLHVKRGDIWQHFCPLHSADFVFVPTERINEVLLVADKSSDSYSVVKEVAASLRGYGEIKVNLLFLACGRCAFNRNPTPAKMLLEQAPQENYCPGTRNAIDKLSALLEDRSIPFVLTVRVENDSDVRALND